jgi:GNAT superfamily N-acetyltransferase
MDGRDGLELANDNAASHWSAMAEAEGWEVRRGVGYTAVRCARAATDSHRVVLTRPPADAGELTRELVALFRDWDSTAVCVEDPYDALDLSGYGCDSTLRMPVMVRPVGAPMTARNTPPRGVLSGAVGAGASGSGSSGAGASGSGSSAAGEPSEPLEVLEAVAPDQLEQMEYVVVEGFPIPGRWPWRSGEMFPPKWIDIAGRRSWLARRGGKPAGACVSWDDGSAVGVYWVAVLPEHRSQGVARALVEAVLRAHPHRPASLTATLLGEPLYRKLGFVAQGETVWWRLPGAGSAYSGGDEQRPAR